MSSAKRPVNEVQRVEALKALGILDTGPEHRFDRLTRLAALSLDVPISLITLVDADRQVFKSHHGLDICETPREGSFCVHVVESSAALTIPDATLDPRFADNPFVTGEPRLRFYFGIPLSGPGGHVLGSFSIADSKPRNLSPSEVQILQNLAEMAEDELDRQELHKVSAQLRQSSQKLASVIHASPLAIISCNLAQQIEIWSPSAEELFGPSSEDVVGHPLSNINTALSAKLSELSRRMTKGDVVRGECVDIMVGDRSRKHLNFSVAPLTGDTGKPTGFVMAIADMTEREDLLRRLEHEHALLGAVMENVNAGVAACDEHGMLTVFNSTARSYIGAPISEGSEHWAEHYQVYDSSGQHLLKQEELPLYRALMGETIQDVELVVRPRSKPERVLLVHGSAYSAQHDSQRGAVVVFHDITSRKQLEQRLEYQASHDFLTGLPNRGALMEILSGAIARAERGREASAVLFLDLDGFKKINDNLGHQVGDQALQTFARRLSAAVRASDTVSRLAGDEFVIIVEQLKNPIADAERIAGKIFSANAAPLPFANGLMLRTSIGIALHCGQTSADELIRLADAAMYRAKQQGGHRLFIDASKLEND